MKGTSVEVLSTENELVLYKHNRGWKRSLRVTLYEKCHQRKVDFPSNRDWLRIHGAPTFGKCVLRVAAAGLKGLLRESEYHIVTAPRQRKVVISGSGRCGTQAIARYLDGMQTEDGSVVDSRHETLHEFILPLLINGDKASISDMLKGMQHDIESAPYYALCPETIHADLVIHLIRDGRRVVQSGINRGWYDNDSQWNRIKPVFSTDRFENCCHLWRMTAENMAKHAQHTFRLEDLIASHGERARLRNVIGLRGSERPIPHVNQGNASSGFERWSERQIEQFSDICGRVMDRYYPNWENEWQSHECVV